MNIKSNEKTLRFLGLFVLLLALANIGEHIFFKEYEDVFWFCNLYGLVLGVSILFQQRALVGTVLVSAIFPQALWIVDFILQVIGYGFGRTAHMFAGGITFHFIISSLLHASCIPIAIYGTYKLGYDKNSVYYAVLAGGILLVCSYAFTSPQNNVNCVFFPCDLSYSSDGNTIKESNFYMTPAYVLIQLFFWFPFLLLSHFFLMKSSFYLNKSIEF